MQQQQLAQGGEGVVASAGILCFSHAESTGDIYFLLCKDYKSPFRWSDLGGCPHKNETVEECAARECWEESLSIVSFYDYLDNTKTSTSKENIHKLLTNKNYILKISIKYKNDNKNRVCFVVRIPWNPDIPEKFLKIRKHLETIERYLKSDPEKAQQYINQCGNEIKNHPAIIYSHQKNEENRVVAIAKHFMEKKELQWWNWNRLRIILRSGGTYKNNDCQMRVGFLSTLALVVEHFMVMHMWCSADRERSWRSNK